MIPSKITYQGIQDSRNMPQTLHIRTFDNKIFVYSENPESLNYKINSINNKYDEIYTQSLFSYLTDESFSGKKYKKIRKYIYGNINKKHPNAIINKSDFLYLLEEYVA